jgi:DNA anti-recombination protein RmuC
VVSASLQVIGGAILLYSINQNMGTFRGHTFKTLALNWIRSYPSSRIAGVANITAKAAIVMGMGSVTATAQGQYSTVEEKLDHLQRQIDETRKLVHEKERLLNEALQNTRTELQASLSQHGTELRRLATVLSESVVGGFKSQLFGGLLVMYGAVLSVFV